MDDFESPEVQKDFPGLYTPGPGKNKKEETEFVPESTKKDKKKEKKDKDKDKGYATLAGGDSSPDEEDTKSPSKSTKRIKAFKFPLAARPKREKSRDKDQSGSTAKKDKKEKKVKSSAGDEPQDLGDVEPIFGVPLEVALQRSRCHDLDHPLPLVVRECIDYLQEFGVKNEATAEAPGKESRVQQLKKLYNNRESNGFQDLDVVTANALLKAFLRDLPEPILTAALTKDFEEVSANSDVQVQERQLRSLVDKLPLPNQVLLKWVACHLDTVAEKNPATTNAQTLALVWSDILEISHRLFVTILCHCRSLFLPTGEVLLPRYVAPLAGANPVLPESREGILLELSKQESLLSQIHSEMNSGFVTKRREEQLWEVQRILTQLKRKLRQVDKKGHTSQKSIEDTVDSNPGGEPYQEATHKTNATDENSDGQPVVPSSTTTPQANSDDRQTMFTITETGFLALPLNHPEASNFMSLQLENYELLRLKQKLQSAINQERTEIHALKKKLVEQSPERIDKLPVAEVSPAEVQELLAQNAYLESVRKLLCNQILSENKELVDLRVQLCRAGI